MKKYILTALTLVFVVNVLCQDLSDLDIKVQKMAFNTPQSEIPSFVNGNELMFFKNKNSFQRYSAFYDLYRIDTSFVNLNNGQVSKISLTEQITSAGNYHEGPCSIDKVNGKIFITISSLDKKGMKKEKVQNKLRSNNLRMLVGDYENDSITNITEFPYNDLQYNLGHGVFSDATQRLYFASTMPGGKGESDLYYCQLDKNGAWQKPVNLGNRVNSAGNELFPTLKNGILFFSSNGQRKQIGKDLDIYYVYEDEIHTNNPMELRRLNTERDEFAICFDDNEDTLKGYFGSNRYNTFNEDDDIYSFVFPPVVFEKKYDLMANISRGDELLYDGKLAVFSKDDKFVQEGVLQENGYYLFPNLVKDDEYRLRYKSDHTTSYFDIENNEKYPVLYKTFNIDDDGLYEDSLIVNNTENLVKELSDDEKKKLGLDPELSELFVKDKLDPNALVTDPNILVNRKTKVEEKKLTEKIEFNRKFDFENIYFDFDSYEITNESKVIIDSLYLVMNSTKAKFVVLNAHTDSRGDKSYNNRLSVKRALACRAYMIKIGVDPDRIKYTGFGESKLVNDCGDGIPCPEDKHLLNRRIEFTVLLN